MKRKRIISNFMLLTAMLSTVGFANPTHVEANTSYKITSESANPELVLPTQPEFPYWFPSQLMEWSPETDENFALNVSTVPLADRVSKNRLETVNSTQNSDTNIMAISIMNATTSGNTPNGLNEFDSYTFSYWQYVDTLVYWGGSAGEGIIVPPTPDVVDIAHKNGVPVVGTVFFPQLEHGGQMEWLNEFLVKDSSGSFPVVDKLIEVCIAYGFDGWFLNQESQGSESEPLTLEHSELVQELILEFKSKAPDLELVFYDSITDDGSLVWQGALTDSNEMFMKTENGGNVADTMFLDFRWTWNSRASQELLKASSEKAKEIGVNPYDLYAGIDVQANGYNTFARYNLFEDENNKPYTSLGLYCPSWTYFSSSNVEEFYEKENTFWVNSVGDPSVDIEHQADSGTGASSTYLPFRSISSYITERSTINSLPFTSNFNLGNGYSFFKDGKLISNLDWNNRSLGDVMPTYRYIIENEGENSLSASIDLTNAYYGGNSIKLEGAMEAGSNTEILLYSTDLMITEEFDFHTILKANDATNVSAVVKLNDGRTVVIDGDNVITRNYNKIQFDTGVLVGKNVRSISLRFETLKDTENNEINLGNITLTNENASNTSTVKNVKVDNHSFDEDLYYAGITLTWDVDKEAEYYEIYSVDTSGSKSLLGVSNKPAFYIHNLKRGDYDKNTFEVVPVNKYMNSGNSSSVDFEWPANILPKASMKANATIVAPNEVVTLTSTSSDNAVDIEWVLEGSTSPSVKGKTAEVSYEEEGVYDVTIIASNPTGKTTETYNKQIVVTNDAKDGLVVLSKNAKTTASSYVNDNEAPQFAVDGDITKKWCAVGSAPHDITIDLGSVEHISQVKIYNAEAGGEGKDMNTSAYEIYVSNDGANFTKVSSEENNREGIISNSFAPTQARFVKVSITKPTQGSDSAARIYEIEVLGLE